MTHKFLFVKANSRLGLINPPKGEKDPNIGVEHGAEFILSNEFLQQFPNREEIIFEFSAPEKVSPESYFEVLAKEYQTLTSQIKEKLDTSKTLLTVGGDHCVSLASIAAVLKKFSSPTTGFIMIDSHADIHQPSTSPSGNFHGMWLRPVVDIFEIPSINSLVPQKIPAENLLYIGNLDIEQEEQEFMESNNVNSFNQTQMQDVFFTQKIDRFIQTMEHIHLSIDIDAFTHTFAPATGMRIENGLAPDDVFPLLKKLKNAKSLSVDVVEVNPTMKGSDQTIQLAQKIIGIIFS